MEHVISIGADGNVRSMHNDRFNIGFLGPQKIDRASDIRFSDTEQSWGIWFNCGGVYVEPSREYAGFTSYDAARRLEVLVMNEALKDGLSPTHPSIKGWAWIRRESVAV